jgi:outer membrane protein OmpA-like peptidoglycan-associated protein
MKDMKLKKLVFSTLLIIVALQGYSQKASVLAADKKYERYAFIDAISTYERIADKGYKDEKMFQRLGNAYYFNAQLPKAARWYAALFEMNQEQEPEYYYRYSQSLKSLGDYDKANDMLDQFNLKSGNDKRAQLYASNKNYLEDIKANSGRFKIENAGINSEYSDYGSAIVDGKLVFASSRARGGASRRIFKWTNQSFTSLYASALLSNGNLEAPELFGNKINTKFNESTPVFAKDGKTVYFTRNNFIDGKKRVDDKKITLLKIYKATLENGKWKDVIELPFNSDQYSVAHPMLSPDNNTLYFSSDMPGTLGQSDLFKVAINADGSYGVPENLGSSINTEGRETFPFISEEDELYFASDGHPGLGGLDVFVSKIESKGGFSEALNVGAPINGPQDDFSFLIDSKTRRGFFTSNRTEGMGYDDIYKITEIRKLICEQELEGLVTDLEQATVLPNTKMSLFDENYVLLQETFSDDNGHYSFHVVCGKTYHVRAEKEAYETKENSIEIAKTNGSITMPFELEKSICEITIGGDLAKCFRIKMIYFDLDKSNIRKDAAFELEKILDVLKEYPGMKIDVRSHTDCRQTARYNLALSDRRAKSTVDWLVKNGIAAARLTGKGYGESQLVNDCGCESTNESNCAEEEHQANRRSEFIVTALE